MATFDPRKLLKQISNPLLQHFFAARGELHEVDWDSLTKHKVEPVFLAWQELPQDEKQAIQLVFQDIHYLSSPRGAEVLLEQIRWKRPTLVSEFAAQKSLQSKAMFVLINAPELMETAAQFARSDQLHGGRSWQRCVSLPSINPRTTRRQIESLETLIKKYYEPRQMRGKYCKVEHQERSDGCDYFFAYLDNYPDSRPEFEGNGGRFVLRSSRSAFENVFIYNRSNGSLDISAKGGRPVREEMQRVFCKCILDWEFDAKVHQPPPYQLDHLFVSSAALPLELGDGIESVDITRMRIEQLGVPGYIELKCDRGSPPGAMYQEIERSLNPSRINRSSIKVRSVTISIVFGRDGRGRNSRASFDVTVPHTCNLKDRPEEQRTVIEKCLKRWGIST